MKSEKAKRPPTEEKIARNKRTAEAVKAFIDEGKDINVCTAMIRQKKSHEVTLGDLLEFHAAVEMEYMHRADPKSVVMPVTKKPRVKKTEKAQKKAPGKTVKSQTKPPVSTVKKTAEKKKTASKKKTVADKPAGGGTPVKSRGDLALEKILGVTTP